MEETIPIQNLSPVTAPPANRSIRAVVTLAWPYSSSTKRCALLLADADARLRARKGQVRVQFTGPSAEAVAKSRVGIGEEVVLKLEGATWAEQDVKTTRTPGRGVDGELVFAQQLGLKIVRAEGEVEVSVDAPASPTRTDGYAGKFASGNDASGTPLPRADTGLRSSLDGSGVPIYSSPAFTKRLRLSGDSFLDSAYDPFMDVAVDEQPSKKLKRSFGGIEQWRYAERSPSPVKASSPLEIEREAEPQVATETPQVEDTIMLDGTDETEAESVLPDQPSSPIQATSEAAKSPPSQDTPIEVEEPPQPPDTNGPHRTIGDMPEIQQQASQLFTQMPPPPLPCLQMPDSSPGQALSQQVIGRSIERQEGPSTPELRAVPNSALPLPSPFPTEAAQAMFSAVDAISTTVSVVLSSPAQNVVDSGGPEMVEIDESFVPEDVVEEVNVETVPHRPETRTQIGEHFREDELPDRHPISSPIVEATDVLQKPEPLHERGERREEEREQPQQPPAPQTPAKLPPSIFSLDGAAATTTPQPHPQQQTPQSQRDRIMAQTYRNLFGFGTSLAAPTPPPKQPEVAPLTPLFGLSEMARARFGESVGQREKRKEEPAIEKQLEIAETQGIETQEARFEEAEESAVEAQPEVAETQPRTAPSFDDAHMHEDEEPVATGTTDIAETHYAAKTEGEAAHMHHDFETKVVPSSSDNDLDMNNPDAREEEDIAPIQDDLRSLPPALSSAVTTADKPSVKVEPADPRTKQLQAQASRPPRSSAATVIELSSSSDVEDEAAPDHTTASDVTPKAKPYEAPALGVYDTQAEVSLSSPLPTSQLDELEDELMQYADVHKEPMDVDVTATESGIPEPLIASSPPSEAVEHPPEPEVEYSSQGVPRQRPSVGRELFPGGPLAHFDSEPVVEDSQDYVSGSLSTQPSPQMDNEPDAIGIPDRRPPLPLEEKALDINVQDEQWTEPEVVMEEMDITPTAPPTVGVPDRYSAELENVMEEMDTTPTASSPLQRSVEHQKPPPSTAQTTVIELSSSSPVQETAPWAEQVSHAPQTQVKVEHGVTVSSPAEQWQSSEARDASSPEPLTQVRVEQEVNTSPLAEVAEVTDQAESMSPEPLTQVRVEEQITSSPPAEVMELPDRAEPMSPEPEPLTQIRVDSNIASSPPAESAYALGVGESTSPEHSTQARVEKERIPLPEALGVPDGDLMEEFVETRMIASPESQQYAIVESEPGAIAEVSEPMSGVEEVPQHETMTRLTPEKIQLFETQLPIVHSLEPEAVSLQEAATGMALDDSRPFATQLPKMYSTEPQASFTEEITMEFTPEQSQQFETQPPKTYLLVSDAVSEQDGRPEAVQVESQEFATQLPPPHATDSRATPEVEIITVSTPKDSQPFETQPPGTHLTDPSYWTLPLSPLASQPQHEVQGLETAQPARSATVKSALPPTPEMMQKEPDVQTPELQSDAGPEAMLLSQQRQTEIVEQQMTGSETETHHVRPISQILEQTPRPSLKKKKTSTRKSFAAQISSHVPDVISAWFSPKRSSGVVQETPSRERQVVREVVVEVVTPAVSRPHVNGSTAVILDGHAATATLSPKLPEDLTNGISTPIGYFTPLSRLEQQLNPSSQHVYGSNGVDVIAVITDSTKAPGRAQNGPRDYYTIFRITESSMPADISIRVEVFRPWKAKLPAADVGDVILLRGFAVKSRKRQLYLLSTDASAWCVWRYADAKMAEENAEKPVWAHKRSDSISSVREEIRGPPVELGNEERQHVRALRDWWMQAHPETESRPTESQREDIEMSGLVSPQLTAKQ